MIFRGYFISDQWPVTSGIIGMQKTVSAKLIYMVASQSGMAGLLYKKGRKIIIEYQYSKIED